MSVKYRFITSLLFCSAIINYSHSADFKMSLSGEIETQAGYRTINSNLGLYDPTNLNSGKISNYGIVNNTKLRIQPIFNAKSYSYGAEIVLNADTSGNKNGSTNPAYEQYVFIKNNLATIQVGSTRGIYDRFTSNPIKIAAATGGISGDYVYWINPFLDNDPLSDVKSYTSQVFLLKPGLPSSYETYQQKAEYTVANKINLITARFHGFSLGVTYTPDTDSHGTITQANNTMKNYPLSSLSLDSLNTAARNVVSMGINYNYKTRDWNNSISLIGEKGTHKVKSQKNIKAYEISAITSYKGMEFSAAFGDWFKSNTFRAIDDVFSVSKGSTKYWAASVGYRFANSHVSLGYFNSNAIFQTTYTNIQTSKPNKTKNYSLGFDYRITKGFITYLELNKFILKDRDLEKKYKGQILLLGTKLIF